MNSCAVYHDRYDNLKYEECGSIRQEDWWGKTFIKFYLFSTENSFERHSTCLCLIGLLNAKSKEIDLQFSINGLTFAESEQFPPLLSWNKARRVIVLWKRKFLEEDGTVVLNDRYYLREESMRERNCHQSGDTRK